jgi:cyclopropane-fatty-acyl-phospholipid synthase
MHRADDDGVILLHDRTLERPSCDNAGFGATSFRRLHAGAVELASVIEKSGLIVSDIEVLRLHYAETLRAWRTNFLAKRDEIIRLFDETPELNKRFGGAQRFIRMWEYYLAGFEASFRYYGLAVFQIQLLKNIEAVPLTRDYMYRKNLEVDSSADFQAAAE